MDKWQIYFRDSDGFVKVNEFEGTTLELGEHIKNYTYLMEVRRVYANNQS
jgi:hypothetical protein